MNNCGANMVESIATVAATTFGNHGNVRLLLKPEEGAAVLGLSRAKFYELLASGQIKSLKIGRSRRVPFVELEKWVKQSLENQ